MASIDGAPIVFVFFTTLLLLFLSPVAFWGRFSFGNWFVWMASGIAGSVFGSVVFMVAGGSDHAPGVLALLPFVAAGGGAWLSQRLIAVSEKRSEQPFDIGFGNEEPTHPERK